ncbi:hypothetical protein HYS82_00130 [Candidatus Amesbacteria bacterium]|nr:hypothetical protein [Candidatus Amesbacteria bacterium]
MLKHFSLILISSVVIIIAAYLIFSHNLQPTAYNPQPTTYLCPPAGWVDCLPGPGPAKPQCQKDYLAWIQSNCPDFQGVAY